MPPRSTVPRSGSTARDSSEASVDLPDPVRPTRAQVVPAGTAQVDVLEGESALAVGEVRGRGTPRRAARPAARRLRRARGRRRAARAAGARRRSPPAGPGRCRASMSTWPTNIVVTRNRVTSERGRQAAVDDQRDADDGDGGQHAVQQRAGAPADPALEPEDVGEPGVDLGRRAGRSAGARAPGRGSCAGRRARPRPPPSLRRGRSRPSPPRPCGPRAPGSSGRTAASAAAPARGNRRNAGHQVSPGHDPQRTGREQGADGLPGALPEQRADLVGVVVDAVEHLADGLLASASATAGAGRRRAGPRAACPRRGRRPRPTSCAPTVSRTAAPTTQAASRHDQRRRGVLGEPSGEQRAQGGAHGCDGARQQRPRRDGTAQPPPVDGSAAVGRWHLGRDRAAGLQSGERHRPRRYDEALTPVL